MLYIRWHCSLQKNANEIEMSEYEKLIKELDTLPDKIQEVIDNQEEIQKFAAKQAAAKDVFLSDVVLIML